MLAASVEQYTRDVEAHVRVANKKGFKHKPKTAVEVGLLIASQLQTLNTTMQGIYDIVRSNVSSPPSRSSDVCRTYAKRVVPQSGLVPLEQEEIAEDADNNDNAERMEVSDEEQGDNAGNAGSDDGTVGGEGSDYEP